VSAAACAEMMGLMINDYDKTILLIKIKNAVTKGGLLASVQLAHSVRAQIPGMALRYH